MTTLKLFDNSSRKTDVLPKLGYGLFWLALFVASLGAGKNAYAAVQCDQTITANVVVLDNPTVFNRLGAQNPNWITYALERDVVYVDWGNPNDSDHLKPITQVNKTPAQLAGNVELRPDKRPRPLVVRSVAGACLTVEFTNLLDPMANPNDPRVQEVDGVACNDPVVAAENPACLLDNNDQVAGRCAGFHASGTELVNGMEDDGSMVGANDGGGNIGDSTGGASVCGEGMAAPGESRTYELFTPHEGAFVVNSYGATLGSESSSGNLGIGMFGALNVQPPKSRIYRSQVTEEELRLATVGLTGDGLPIIDYEAKYPNTPPWSDEGKGDLPILNMITASGELVHSDINAIIAGPDADGTWNSLCPGSECPYPLESVGKNNPQLPNRLEPFREFTSIYHDEQTNSQVFPKWYGDPVLGYTLDGVGDAFMINYGSGGIGSEIIANRLHTGPMHDCTDCAYEEFFLASQTVGDPGLLVEFPANTGIEACSPQDILSPDCWRQFDQGPDMIAGTADDMAIGANPPIPGNQALFQEDPSNVHHSYTGDFTKIRNTHAGAFEQHIFHLHNHQWLFNPNDDNANYLDAQEIMPGSGHTYELVNGGVGNRNKTAGDAIFHCHFYPHFAQGMWYHIRIQDVFERGTVLAVSNANDPHDPALDAEFHTERWALRSGRPADGARALPDGELPDGVPIPAIVPLPGKAMPPMPAKVSVVAVDRGDFGVLSGRRGPNELGQGPDSSQAIVDFADVLGADGEVGGGDDKTPGYPFWLAGNSCGEGAVDNADPALVVCPEGTVGQRMPTPVLDMLTEDGANAAGFNPNHAGGWDGGLPRHNLRGYTSGGLSLDTQNRLDFRKIVKAAAPVYYPETGTVLEQVSMNHHAVRNHPSVANNLEDLGTTAGDFVLNGSAPVPGGPFNDPCVDDTGAPANSGAALSWFDGDGDPNSLNTTGSSAYGADNPRTYKIANIQIDAVFNKVGHHYSQERIIALWEDVEALVNKQKPPEPLVMRFNTFDCGKILHANLVPAEFEVDDFQVRTPTDIIGQHIHLPKWDLTTNDGAANGWNYEDGTLSPLMVQERIEAINNFNELAGTNQNLVDILTSLGVANDLHPELVAAVANHQVDLTGLAAVPTLPNPCGDDPMKPDCGTMGGKTHLEAEPHPFFGTGVDVNGHFEYLGARTTIQRILVDPVVNVGGVDRGLGLTFSHDHYGPSTFQQIGLYSTILAEPAGSEWYHNESGEKLGTRDDGGPTTWQAAIITPNNPAIPTSVGAENVEDHREFYFEMSDFQHAYNAGTYVGAGPDGRPLKAEFGEKIKQIHHVIQPDPFDATVATAPSIEGTWLEAVNPTLKLEAEFPDVVTAEGGCPGPGDGHPTNNDPNVPRPCAEAINIGHSSIWVSNYRNEPIGLRVFDPDAKGPDGQNGAQAEGKAGDLAFALQSRSDRAISQLNTAFGDTPYPTGPSYCEGSKGDLISCDRGNGDPFTPIMRAFERDQVKIKIQVGATEEQHQATIHGMKWLSNSSGFGRSPNSGWRNFQSTGISEQFSLQVPMNPDPQERGAPTDYLYANDATRPGMWLGTWGILRAYGSNRQDLYPLPDSAFNENTRIVNQRDFRGVCPRTAPVQQFDVYAVLANDALPNNLGVTIPPNTQVVIDGKVVGGDSDGVPGGDNAGGPLDPQGGTLVYNRRGTEVPDLENAEEGGVLTGGFGPLNDPTAMMYVLAEDLEPADMDDTRCFEEAAGGKKGKGGAQDGPDYNIALEGCPVKLKADAPVEPLVLRANAGDCIEVTLHNKLVQQAVADVGMGKEWVYSCERVWDADLGIFTTDCVADSHLGLFATDQASDDLDADLMHVTASGGIVQYKDVNGNVVKNADIEFDDRMPDLAGWQDMMWGVTRRIQDRMTPTPVDDEMHFFNNNLVRPSAYVGLHPQLVEYDASRHDGVLVGSNNLDTLAKPGGKTSYTWYAGDLTHNLVNRGIEIVATPIEFGATNLLSADRIKQPQKGMFGALAIEPAGSTYAIDTQVPDGQMALNEDGTLNPDGTRPTRAQMTINAPPGDAGSGGTYREALAIGHKIANLRWKDGSAIKNINQGELGREGAEDSGHAGFNYGMEPSWFRFQLPPNVPFGNAGTPNSYGSIPNVQAMYANNLVAGEPNSYPGGDPATPVFVTTAGTPTRMHVLNGASADRDGTFILHGHLWQRDPYVCTGSAQDSSVPLPGRCDPSLTAPSQALGVNPQGKYMGGEEGMGHVYGYWPILFNAGGTGAVPGDYLFRDYSPSGNRNGMFGILRVEDPNNP